METLIIKIAAVVVAVIFWLVMIYLFERGARKKVPASGRAEQTGVANPPARSE